MTRGLSRQAGIPPTHCTARNRRGERCRNFCSVGRLTCYMHFGNAPQNVRKGEERATFAQLLQSDPRPVGEVLLDALHNADTAMRDIRAQLVEEGQPVTVDQLDRFINLSRLTHHLAKTTVDAGVEVELVRRQKADLELMGQLSADILWTVLDALPLHPAWRRYLVDLASRRALEIGHQEERLLLDPPTEPIPPMPIPPREPILLPGLPSPLQS
jgi:hypothetical protein